MESEKIKRMLENGNRIHGHDTSPASSSQTAKALLRYGIVMEPPTIMVTPLKNEILKI